ncbi:MAG TPA: CPBP family intramembrane metalloprotease, partial [Holophaga sp.]|nr:CPBP family intramembrane metalloprotease [Holophaga sp.]
TGVVFVTALGVGLLAWAEGRPLRTVLGPFADGSPLRSLGWAAAFLAGAVAAVITIALALAPLMGPGEPPQRELMDLIGGTQGLGSALALFITVAVLAPVFEEILFRGFLLPWLQPRLAARWGLRWGTFAALLLTALAFGAMHLQPRGLHVLSTLGLMLGWAVVRTGDLRTAILVHGAWNGGIFLLVRSLA